MFEPVLSVGAAGFIRFNIARHLLKVEEGVRRVTAWYREHGWIGS